MSDFPLDLNDNYEDMDLKIINFIKMINNKENEVIPEPKYFTISTQSAMCSINNVKMLDLSKIVVFIAKGIITNIIFKNDPNYLIRGIVVDNLILRFDESYLKKYKKPFIKYMNITIDPNNIEDCLLMLSSIEELEKNSLKKHGRQKKKKDNENFYNSCSIIVKASQTIKCVNIKLFNNGKISLTGSKYEYDGYHACVVLLEELKKQKLIFTDMIEEDINKTKIENYKITMINSDFHTNFKIDLLKLLNILNTHEKELFTKFNPEKYRGLIIGYYWNTDKEEQNGRCICKTKCNGKGCGTGDGQCKKITISLFKSGSIIITGGRLVKQIEDAYKSINNILKEYYHDIIKMSILDYIDDDEDEYKEEDNNDEQFDNIKNLNKKKLLIQNDEIKKSEKKIIKIKKIIK
jgi:TATA-box binding protein (TBP) (component of TFIID and TFIIIB)